MADYVVADLHFNHKNVIKFSERSNFSSVEEMNEFIINIWNKTINPSDNVYILGDIGFGKDLKPIIDRLHGYKIMIKGNHDKETNNFYLKCGINEVYNHPIYYSSTVILSHYPLKEALNNDYVINIHGHLHNSYLNLDNYFNANIANTNYHIYKIDEITARIKERLSRRESFLNEWYAGYYVFKDDRNDVITDYKGLIDLPFSKMIQSGKNEMIIEGERLLDFQSKIYDFHQFITNGYFLRDKFLFDGDTAFDTINKIIDAYQDLIIKEIFTIDKNNINHSYLSDCLYKMAVGANYIVRDYQLKNDIRTMLTDMDEKEFKDEYKVFKFSVTDNNVYHILIENEYLKTYCVMNKYLEDVKNRNFDNMIFFYKKYINADLKVNLIKRYFLKIEELSKERADV